MQGVNRSLTRESNINEYLIILDRRKWIIIAAIILTLASTAFYIQRTKPVYQAQTRIIIEPKRAQEIVFPQSVEAISLDLETQVEVIKSEPVLASVVKWAELTEEPEGLLGFTEAVNNLRKNIKIEFVKNTKVITITARHHDPEKAQMIADAIARTYIEQDRLSRLETGREAVRWLSNQIADLKMKLKNSEDALQQFKEREKMVTFDDKRKEDLEQMSQLNQSYVSVKARRLEIEALINKLGSKPGTETNIPIALLDTPNLQKLGDELSKLQTELADKRRLFKDTYPAITDLKEKIRLIEQKIIAELKKQQDFLKAQEDSLLAQQSAKREEMLKLSRKEQEYLALEREVNTNREMYNTLLSKVKELSLAGEADLNNIRIIEPAKLPTRPMGNKIQMMILGGVAGLLLGIGLAFMLERLEDTIRTPDDVVEHLALPVLGVIPRVEKTKKSRTPPIVVTAGTKSAPAEAYRTLRTNLLSSGIGNPIKTIMVTSAGPKEGKSITAINLGVALAQAGHKVILVDADLRRPTLHRVFNVERQKGLSSVLSGDLPLTDVIAQTPVPNLSVIPSGSLPSNPSEVLGSQTTKEVLDQLRQSYDFVLVDSAPVLGMADTCVLAPMTDATLLVIEAQNATRKALKVAVSQLEQVSAKILGVVLNDVNVKRDRYYSYYYYYYYSPYEDEEGKKVRKRRHRA